VQIGVLGPLEVRDGDTVLEISGARLRQLLTVLAVNAPRAVSVSSLVEALWPDEPPADATNALQSLVSRLRRALGDPDLVQQAPGGYRLAVDASVVDLHRFDELSRRGHEALVAGDAPAAVDVLAPAIALWRGAPSVPDAEGARLAERRLDALGDLLDARLTSDADGYLISELEGLVASHPLRERFALLLIRALQAVGRSNEALAAYERTRQALANELGTDPGPDLRAAHLDLLQPAVNADLRRRPAHNLRATLTSFVGRDEQLARIDSLLATSRLITLVGPGGAGKTRLAGVSAAAIHDATDGVWLAELAPVSDPADVPQTVLGSLGLRDAILIDRTAAMTPRDATTRLVDALSDRRAVLVLDNCEHLIEAAAHLADHVLARCPDLRIVATSREPLGIMGESLVVVPPLGQPTADVGAAEALTYPAVQLFADRARGVAPNFAVDESTVGAVVEIVRRLDGLPLAIELAAARLRTLPVTEIRRRLSDRFRLLTGGNRTAMPRHRTLRAVVEWSWDLLTGPERLLAERLAVFAGGVTPDAARAVCCHDDLAPEQVDDGLTSLADKSLLQVVSSAADAGRFRMLETIREFGMERMAERGEVATIRLAHARHFAALAAAADPGIRSREQLHWMAQLDIERDNVIAALKFFGDDGRASDAIRLANQLGWYWMTIGSHSEIVTWMTFALDVPGDVEPIERLLAEAFLAINSVAWNDLTADGDADATMCRLREVGTEMAAVVPATANAPPMLILLAPVVAMFIGKVDQVGPLTERALHHDDPWIAAAVRAFRATMAENFGDVRAMREDAEAALEAFRDLGERWGLANTLQVMGQLELMEGRLEAAAAAFAEGLELASAIGGRDDIAMSRLRLADVLTRLGRIDEAREHAALARQAARRGGSPAETLLTHIVESELARSFGEVETARALRDDAIAKLRLLPAVHPIQSHGLALMLAISAKIDLGAGDLESARTALDEGYVMALETKDMPIVAAVGVAVAMLAHRLGRESDAATILGAATQLRGADDITHLDIATLDEALGGLLDGPYAADYARGRALERADAIARVAPSRLDDDGSAPRDN
jgi:predicted ATPase/DNA-binding SARP family transcriptional activator